MKSKCAAARLLLAVLSLVVFASASFAATNPLNFPYGLALDASGNLYVANLNAHNILVYSPGYVLQSAQTIGQGADYPFGVAIDPFGNVWVANEQGEGNGYIAEFVQGVQNTAATITNGIVAPTAIAIDGEDDIFVVNDFAYLTVYAPSFSFQTPSNLISNTAPANPLYGIAVGQGTISYGTENGTLFVPTTGYLLNNYGGIKGMGGVAIAIATDSRGYVYAANNDHTISLNIPIPPGLQGGTIFTAPFQPHGIAVDHARDRIYLADPDNNKVWVYSTTGKLLKTIK